MRFFKFFLFFYVVFSCEKAPTADWQQHVDYKMVVDVDVKKASLSGLQQLVYSNNSPDTINRVFYHLYFNAFNPGSEMQVRASQISDDYKNISQKILDLKKEDRGNVLVNELYQDGVELTFVIHETILEAQLSQPLYPGEQTTLSMNFDVQVPKEVRRAGKNNADGVAFSMSQWYPKICAYDKEGWHANAYIGREFYGVWGDFDVTIKIDKDYTVAASGYLQNPGEIGHGYAKLNEPYSSEKLSWRFLAPNVHDFSWAADNNYVHDVVPVPGGPVLHFFYKNDEKYSVNWKKVQPFAVDFIKYFSKNIGPYPYKQYSIILAGDGGMEYAMCTFIGGIRDFESLAGVISHEIAHTWFQFLLASNESKHAWIDEGFTSYISDQAENEILEKNLTVPNRRAYVDYFKMVKRGGEEPLTTHADRFSTNANYRDSSYDKGSVFLSQLGYIVGFNVLNSSIKRYFSEFKFKHPVPEDFIRVVEKESKMELDWYLMDWGQTTKTIDYSVEKISDTNGVNNSLVKVDTTFLKYTKVFIERKGEMAISSDVSVTLKNGTVLNYHIPLTMARGNKNLVNNEILLKAWPWANKNYNFVVYEKKEDIVSISIDPKNLSADINKKNNNFFNSLKNN